MFSSNRSVLCYGLLLRLLYRLFLPRRSGCGLLFTFTTANQTHGVRGVEWELPDRVFRLTCGLQSDVHAAIAGQFNHTNSSQGSLAFSGCEIRTVLDRSLHFLDCQVLLLSVSDGFDV